MKKKIIISILAIVMIVACLGSLVACNTTEKLVGFDTELAAAFAKELNLEIQFVEIDWDVKETMLNSKQIDLVWNGFTYTEDRDNGYYDEERQKQIGGLDFSNYYMENKQVAIVKKSNASQYTNNESFAGKKGCAEATSAGQEVVVDILGCQCDELGKQLDVFTAVKSGTNDFGVIDLTMASEYILSENAAYKDTLAIVQVEGVEVEHYAVGCREGSNLKEVMNYTLAKLFENGTALNIAKKYNLTGNLCNGFASFTEGINDYKLPTDGDFARIKDRGTIIVGYTIFKPMNYME